MTYNLPRSQLLSSATVSVLTEPNDIKCERLEAVSDEVNNLSITRKLKQLRATSKNGALRIMCVNFSVTLLVINV